MRSTILASLFVACALVLGGPASAKDKSKQSLTIHSSPAGATVYENGAEVGITPYHYTYDKPDGGAVTMELRKDGYQPVTFELTPKARSGVLLADAMLLNIPYYFGRKSGSLYAFPRQELTVNLYRTMPTGLQEVALPVAPLQHTLGARAGVGRLGTHKLTVDSREVGDLAYPEMVTSSIVRGFADSFVDAHSVRPGTPKGDEAVQRAKVLLKPVIKRIDLDLDEVDDRAYGSVTLDMEWRFLSGIDKDSVLFTITRSTTAPVFALSPRDVLATGLQDAARRMLEEEGLYERLNAAHSAGLMRSKGAGLSLSAPVPIGFTGRKDMLAALVKGVVTIETKDGHGSGFLITNDGNIMTNAHVVGTEAHVKVRFEQGFALDGEVVKTNRDFDVALVKVAGSDLPALALGDDAALQLGEELFAIGTPLDEQLGQSVTRGIMSGRREIEGRSYLQTDVSINSGNSGGPLIDESGKVVGVATLKIKASGVEGIGFGVPISKALEMLNITFTRP